MTDTQLKKGDLIVFRSRIDCQTVTSVEYDEDGEIKSLYITDGVKTRLLKWEDRADDPVIELPVSLGDVLKEVMEIHESLQYEYEHRYINFDVEQVENPFGKLVWKSKLYVERKEKDLPYVSGSFLDWEMTGEEVRVLVKELFDAVVNNFTLI